MNNNSSMKGWLSCMVLLIIIGVILAIFFRYAWIIIPVVLVVNLVKRWLWQRRVKKAQQQIWEFVDQTRNKQDNYCEAEFEILEDDPEG